jgi:hypothetical protein
MFCLCVELSPADDQPGTDPDTYSRKISPKIETYFQKEKRVKKQGQSYGGLLERE